MKNIVVVILGAIIAIGLGGCHSRSVRPSVQVSDNYLIITGVKFRKTGSINVDLFRAGVKRSKGVNAFYPRFFPVLEGEIKATQATQAFNQQTSKAAIEAAAEAKIDIAETGIETSGAVESKLSGSYSVFTFQDIYDYVDALNSPKNRKNLERLMREKEPRVITSVAMVFNSESSRKVSSTGSLSLIFRNPEIGNPEFTVKSESTGKIVAKLSDWTVFAYEYARICWERKDGAVRVQTIAVDRPGPDNDCPVSATDDASKL